MARSRSRNILRTTDLALATYLRSRGHEPDLSSDDSRQVKRGHPQGEWEFDGDAVASDVKQFNDGKATVEPNSYHILLNRTRREMFKFLGIGTGSD